MTKAVFHVSPPRVLFVAVLFCLRAAVAAVEAVPADEYLHFRRLTPEAGLPTEQVLRIFEDSRGFLWFGTSDGLARYDSHEFRVFRPDPKDSHSLGNSSVSDIQEDAQGNLWIATLGGLDLWRRDTEQFSHFRHNPTNAASLSDDGIQCLLLDTDGSLWVGTSGAGLNHLDPRSGKCARYMPEPDRNDSLSASSIHCLLRDRKGQIWIGTGNGGLNRFDPQTGKFRVYAITTSPRSARMPPVISGWAPTMEFAVWIRSGVISSGFPLRLTIPAPRNPGSWMPSWWTVKAGYGWAPTAAV
jgi:ligand-binding sensor domain-containing protein